MAIDIFEPLKDLQGNKQKGASWYRNAVSLITDRSSPSELFASGKLLGRPSAGRMSMFFYDPKFKQRLPYYDTFPLVLPLEPMRGGFIGLNFHYLKPGARVAFLRSLADTTNNKKFDSTTRYRIPWRNNLYMRKTAKHYLFSQVRSSFLNITADEMAIAIFLPVARFKKGSPY